MQAAWAHAPGQISEAVAAGAGGSLRPELLLPLATVTALYAVGAWRLSRRRPGAIRWTRPAFASASLACVLVALVSPLDASADRSFFAHMAQHMLLIVMAAPAMLLADPLPIVLWGLPREARVRIGRALTRGSTLRRLWGAATATATAWLLYAGVLWLWHVPAAYDAALGNRLLHDAEHVTFFAAALVFWWPVIHPAPRLRRAVSHPVRIVYLVLAAFQTAALGLLLTLAPSVLYRSYAVAHVDAAAALEDQVWGGIVMWAVGGLVDMLAVLVVLARALTAGEPVTAPTGDRARAS
jgi:putative membrane protein